MSNRTLPSIVRDAFEVIPPDAFSKRGQEADNRKLHVKLGFDPTAPDLHLGHAVVLRKLKEFQEFGHKITVIVGDFTAMIGDPTGRDQTRPALSKAAIQENSRTYLAQLGKIVDTTQIDIRYNSEWLQAINFSEIISIASKFTLSRIISRDDFRNRTAAGNPIALHEFLYPLMQAYDSVAIQADIELGGSDQLFNCMMGRDLQEKLGLRPQIVLILPLLVGTDGIHKMSKSKGNAIGLTEPPEVMYGQCLSIPDRCLAAYLRLATSCDNPDLLLAQLKSGELHPMALKKIIAFDVVKTYYDEEKATLAADYFQRTVQEKRLLDSDFIPISLTELGIQQSMNIVEIIHRLMPSHSNSSIRRLIQGGGVYLNSRRVSSLETSLDPQVTPWRLRVGKKASFLLTA
jgi:tyrosyl-tRNA synthetase